MTSEKDSLSLDLKKARKHADEMLENWRKEIEVEEQSEEDDDDDDDDDVQEEVKDGPNRDVDSSEEEESETDSSDTESPPPQLNGVSNASSTEKSLGPSTSSLMTGSRMRIGEGGPSQCGSVLR